MGRKGTFSRAKKKWFDKLERRKIFLWASEKILTSLGGIFSWADKEAAA